MIIGNFFLNICAIGILVMNADSIYYRSDALQELKLIPITGEYNIRDDNNNVVEITAMADAEGILYWYRRIETPVCLTGECKLVDVGLYWYCTGTFLGLEVYGEPLTKTDHSKFSDADYDKLMSVLNNDWSSLKEYDFSDLIEEKAEGDVDAASGATRKEIASEAVADAVYTTYTLWHLVHNGEKEQLSKLTADQLNKSHLANKLITNGRKEYRYFLLDLLGLGKLAPSDEINSLMMEGLKSGDDPYLKNLAFRALSMTPIDSPGIQSALAGIYPDFSPDEKLQILMALKGLRYLGSPLYHVLAKDLDIENEWFSVKILTVLLHGSGHAVQVVEIARKLSESQNSFICDSALEFLNTGH